MKFRENQEETGRFFRACQPESSAAAAGKARSRGKGEPMNISILAVGKCREKYWQEAVAEYSRRLGRYCRLEICEVADEKTPEGAGPALTRRILQKEGERLMRQIRSDATVIVLDLRGEAVDSVEFSHRIEEYGLHGVSRLQFVIGGSLGLAPEVVARADWRLSFSKMTFPHPLMRVILLEQIYRAYRIMRNEPYHK